MQLERWHALERLRRFVSYLRLFGVVVRLLYRDGTHLYETRCNRNSAESTDKILDKEPTNPPYEIKNPAALNCVSDRAKAQPMICRVTALLWNAGARSRIFLQWCLLWSGVNPGEKSMKNEK